MKHPVEKILNTRGITEVNYEKKKRKAGVWLCERKYIWLWCFSCRYEKFTLLKQYTSYLWMQLTSVQIPSTGGTTGGNSVFVPYGKSCCCCWC